MKVILLKDVKKIGRRFEEKEVNDGYARNCLLPQKLGAHVTKANMRRLEAKKLRMQREHEERVAVAQSLADKMSKISVTIPVEASENDKLYGSVSAPQIAAALAEEGIEIGRSAVVLEEPIRELGVYSVELRLHTEVQTTLKVWVVRA